MGKEIKIGLAVVGVLLVIFSGLVVRRIMMAGPAAPTAVDTAQSSRLHTVPIPAADEPTVVMAQRDSARATGGVRAGLRGAGARGDAAGEVPADMPHGSFLPADAAADAGFGPQGEPTIADNDASGSPAETNPFARRLAGRDRAVETSDQPPQKLDVAPDGAAALDARKQPPRATRNPLRRLSAEVPLDETPQASDLSLDAPISPAAADELAAGDEQPSGSEPADARPADPLETPADDALAIPARGAADATDEPQPVVARPRSRYQLPASADPPAGLVDEPAAPANGQYTIQPNDSLWKISEKVYGNGRYFKAIQEHNRAKLPQPDRLVAGTVISVPPASELEQNYPSLCPKQRRSAVVKSRAVLAGGAGPAARGPSAAAGGDVYVVADGDTLFDIARYELGKASRWGEIYELNREALGEDFDYLQPGLELKMPERQVPASTISREPSSRYQR